jgi:ATP-binding cassette subfamily B protein
MWKCLKRIGNNMSDTEDDNNDELYKNARGGHGPGAGRDYRKPKDIKGTLIRILGYAVKNRLLIVAILGILVLASVLSLVASYLLKPIIDDYIVPQITAEVKDYSGLAHQLLKLMGIYLCAALATYIQSRALVTLAQNATNAIRRDLFSKLQDLPISFFDAHTHGEIMSRFTNDADNVQMALEQGMTQVISAIITFVGTLVLMIIISWKLCIITLIVVALSTVIVKKLGTFSKIMFKKQQAALGRLNGYIEEMTDGLKVVKAFNYEDRAIEEFNKLDDEYRESAVMANFLGLMSMPILSALMNLCYAVTAAIGGMMVMTNTFTIGSLGVFLNYTRQVSMPLSMISNQIVNLMSAVAGAERVFAIIDADPETDDGKVTLVTAIMGEDGKLSETTDGRRTGTWAWKIPNADGSIEYREVKGDVRLNDVHFSYVPGKPVLKGISVYAKPGQKIAFVGSTGAGKTTITNLINRFYEIDSGVITYDGIDICDIHKAGLRRSLGIVLQDTNLFTGTVMDNIRYGKLDATDEECIEAAKSANAHGFITRLPDGYNTYITGNGGNLSQGQRQLLAIARTAVAKHPVMILDEATSSIDTRTEKLIESGLDTLMENKTVFVIAHRLSTVRNSQAIAVIEHGEIIEKGSHEELLSLGGRYYMLYTGQHELD